MIIFSIFLGISIACGFENEVGFCILFAVFECLPVFVFAISPLYFVFFEEAVEIVYLFGQREWIEWHTVSSIYTAGSWFFSSGFPRYVFVYPRKEKRLFFVVGEISKTIKTKKLIKKYYKNKIV